MLQHELQLQLTLTLIKKKVKKIMMMMISHPMLILVADVRIIINHTSVQGDPFVNCVLNPCSQSPCGINADCSATGARAVCRCRANYEGGNYRYIVYSTQ